MKALSLAGLLLLVTTLCQNTVAESSYVVGPRSKAAYIDELFDSADSLAQAENVDSAMVLAEELLELVGMEYGQSDSVYAEALYTLAGLHNLKDELFETIQCYKKWLELVESEPDYDRWKLAEGKFRLGAALRLLSRYDEGEPYVRDALHILENLPETPEDEIADRLNELARICMFQLKYAEAESLIHVALDRCRKGRGGWSILYAEVANQLGNLYYSLGRSHEAESLYWLGVHIRMSVDGPMCKDLAESLNNLGNIYRDGGSGKLAKILYTWAIRVRELSLGPDHPYLVYALVNLGETCGSEGNVVKAESLCYRALNNVEGAYSRNHAHAAWALTVLGDIYRWQGEYERAEICYRSALEIKKAIFVPEHPDVAEGLNRLALLHAEMGSYPESRENFRQSFECNLAFIEKAFSYASEEQKLRYTNMHPLIDPMVLSLAQIDTSTQSRALALEMTLKGKARVIDDVSAERRVAVCGEDDNIERTEEQLGEVGKELSRLSLANLVGTKVSKKYLDSLQVLNTAMNSLETELSRLCSEFKVELATERFDVADVAASLPEAGVLWEFVRYRPYQLEGSGSDKDRMRSPRYMAFTLDDHGKVTITDLGDAGEIDSLVGLARKRIYEANAEVSSARAEESERRLSELTVKLYGTMFAPLEAKLNGSTDIYVSPDGALSLLPLEILSCPDGEYAIEKYRVTYLSSGRDLLRFEEKPPSGDRALIMASPDFDSYIREEPEHKDKAPQVHGLYAFIPEPARSVSECLDALFTRLLHSREEAESISGILKRRAGVRVDNHFDAQAREEVLKTMESAPWVLHLATHGFFCPAPDVSGSVLENPLLRCGLAFAGANLVMTGNYRFDANQEDGFFSALEASALNLIGTELVVLSSCETGVGEIRNSEGVYGLRRAFQHAGARTIIMSLWKVQDKETRELMETFYNNWMSGDTKKEALRKAALKILNDHRAKGESTHPLLWVGFVLLGDPN